MNFFFPLRKIVAFDVSVPWEKGSFISVTYLYRAWMPYFRAQWEVGTKQFWTILNRSVFGTARFFFLHLLSQQTSFGLSHETPSTSAGHWISCNTGEVMTRWQLQAPGNNVLALKLTMFLCNNFGNHTNCRKFNLPASDKIARNAAKTFVSDSVRRN